VNAYFVLLPIIIALTWLRLVRPGINRIEGTVLHVAPLPILARMRMHVMPSLLALIAGVALVAFDAMPAWLLAMPILSAVLLVTIPVNYTLTDQGIRLGWSVFRRWTEFGGVRRAAGGAHLQPVMSSRGMHIWLSRSRGDDEFLQVLRTLIRNAYKGQTTVVTFPDAHEPFAGSGVAGPKPQGAEIP
jgi:hypothetical protein